MGALLLCFLGLCAYALYGAYWRLYLSPIAHIPGPKLAAITRFYEAYFDLWLGGQYTFKIIELHKQYGPIIRISPWEVHISDPDFYEVVCASSASGHRRDKYEWFTKSFGLDKSAFATPDHDLHKMRKAALAPVFTLQNVRKLQPHIQERVNVLLFRLLGFRDTNEILMASNAHAAFTNDIVKRFSFGYCDRRLEAPDFDPSYRDASFFGSTAGNFLKHAPWLNQVAQALPDWVVEKAHPAMATWVGQKRMIFKQVNDIHTGANQMGADLEYKTIFHSILDAKLPEHEKSSTRLTDDGQVLMAAGTLTTALVLDNVMFWLLRQPSTLRKLKAELKAFIPHLDMIGTKQLSDFEKLPYLNTVMKEGLRLTYGVSTRLARIDPDKDTIFNDGKKDIVIPRGTPMGMTSTQVHHDESLFPNSKLFSPERWLDAKNKAIDRYILSFTAGSRQCLGIYLAHAEMYLALSAVWRQWGSREVQGDDDVGFFELFETGTRDVEIESDWFLPIAQPGSQGIRVKAYSCGK